MGGRRNPLKATNEKLSLQDNNSMQMELFLVSDHLFVALNLAKLSLLIESAAFLFRERQSSGNRKLMHLSGLFCGG